MCGVIIMRKESDVMKRKHILKPLEQEVYVLSIHSPNLVRTEAASNKYFLNLLN